MIQLYYTDPPGTENGVEDQDISNYVLRLTWSGDTSQAARKIEFEVAYNAKDETFINLSLQLGGLLTLSIIDDEDRTFDIFYGRIFFRRRSTDGYTFSITAYDDMIYLAKSKIQRVFEKVTVTDAIKQVCNEIGVPVSEDIPQLNTVVSFLAENKSCTETFGMLFERAHAETGKTYTALMLDGALTVVEKGTMVEDYVASDKLNISNTEHSENIENMVNRVKAIDQHGAISQVFSIEDDVQRYGLIQDIYKMQPPKEGETVDNVKMAKDKLKRVETESSLNGIGYFQCITGYAITVEEEQLQGKFFIKSDSHTFENQQHTMKLSLEYMPDKPEEPVITQTDVAPPYYKTSKRKRKRLRKGEKNE